MTIEENPSSAREEESSEDDNVKDDTYMPSPQAPIRGRGKALASGSGATEIQEEEEEETFDVEEITPTSYVHMGNPVFRQPLDPNWSAKVSYKGKTDLVREKRKKNPRLVEKKAGLDYRFHTAF
jgi:hypothetical protein